MKACLFMRLSLALLAFASALSAQEKVIFLWPNGTPEPTDFGRSEYDPTTDANRIVSGKVTIRVTDVSRPSITVFQAATGKNQEAGILVFPGGGYDHLAWNIEGTEVCEWFQSNGITCAVLKYRVPEKGRFPDNPSDLEDAQQAMRVFRMHAQEWQINPDHIGVIGFSAGGHLAALLSRQYGYQGKGVPNSAYSARPDFQILLYPGLGLKNLTNPGVDPIHPNKDTPPTFIAQAIDDPAARVENTLAYLAALKEAGVPAEIHLYSEGGHGYGLRPTKFPITGWPTLVERWLNTINMLNQRRQTLN